MEQALPVSTIQAGDVAVAASDASVAASGTETITVRDAAAPTASTASRTVQERAPVQSSGADAVAADAAGAQSAASQATSVAREARPAEPFVLPLEALEALAQEAGLQWVHSDTEKVKAAQDAIANEPRPVRVPREPRAAVVIDEGPLVLVETRKDLSQVRLPFDA